MRQRITTTETFKEAYEILERLYASYRQLKKKNLTIDLFIGSQSEGKSVVAYYLTAEYNENDKNEVEQVEWAKFEI